MEAVSVASALGQIRGHQRVSLELFEAGDKAGAVAHATHPVAEIMESIRSDLEDAGAPAAELDAALQAGVTAAGGDSVEDLQASFTTAADLTRQSEDAVAGEAVTSSAYRGSVIADLLAVAGHEYEEAIADGAVSLLVEYQDAYGFTAEARDLYEVIRADVEAASQEEAAEIDEAFADLGVALPGAEPPTTPAAPEDVEAATSLIGHELEETVGAQLAAESDAEAEAGAINALLDQIVPLVEAGERAAAAELAAEAYLEHYEVIEADVIAVAPEINAALEPLLGAELRRQINDGASAADIQALIDQARGLLSQAVAALGEH